MAKSTVLVPIRKSFERRVDQLAKEGSEIVASYAELTSRMLKFATDFKAATDEAARLDGGAGGIHAQYLKDNLATAVRTTNPSIWSRWNTIGTYASTLGQYSDFLPPQRDSLYEIALAVKGKKPIGKWIEGEKITVDSSVRELRALRQPKSTSLKMATSGKKGHLNARVTLCFPNYNEAVNALADLVMGNTQLEVRSHRAFADALKAKVGLDDFKKVKDRIR